MNFKLLCITLLFGCSLAEKFSYHGYKVFDLYPSTKEQIDLIEKLEHQEDFDLWSRVKGGVAKISLAPAVLEKYETLFKQFKLKYEIVNHNLQDVIDEEERQLRKRDLERNIVGTYARHNDIDNWLQTIAAQNPSIASTYIAGQTYEKRNLRVITIGTSRATRKVWIDCGIHAREWVSPSTCVWVINNLITRFNQGNADAVELLNYYQFHVLPVLNPDGYEYTQTTSRLWRKNRRVNTQAACPGVDLNRNFPYQWMTGGSSSNACADTYAGPSAGSELETQAVIKALNTYKGLWDSYLTIHSYGKWWFTPYGHSASVIPPQIDVLNNTAKVAVNALVKTYNETGWTHGISSQMLYVASGGSEDWAHVTGGIKYSYCIELRPGQSGTDSNYGFQLPVDRAPFAGEETYNGIVALLKVSKSDNLGK